MKIIREFWVFVPFVLMFFLVPSLALALGEFECKEQIDSKKAQSFLTKVEKRYQTFSDLEARFLQRSYFVGLGREVISKGSVLFKKPGMMDWCYEEPDKQRFVADGKTLWFYQPDLNQVTLGAFTQAFQSDLPVSFLLGVGSLSENFVLKSACKTEAGVAFNLSTQTKDPNLEDFRLLVRDDDFIPIGAKVVDVGGNETTIVFDKVSLEGKLKEEQFTFEIPRGVDVIDHRTNTQPRIRLLQ